MPIKNSTTIMPANRSHAPIQEARSPAVGDRSVAVHPV